MLKYECKKQRMDIKMKKFGILVVVFIVCVAFLSSYANADVETEKISLNGSTSMEKMVNALKEGLEDKYPELLIEPQFTGSSAGIEAVLNGTTDIGNSSRYLKDSEKEKGLIENIVAIDAIVIVTDTQNKVNNLTTQQLIDIYTGKIRNWKEVGGEDLPIRCKVFYGLSELDEAILFAQQTGASAQLTAGARLRALVYGRDPDALAFLKATESVGLRLDYNQDRGKHRIGCVGTAYGIYKKVGEEIYKEGMQHIVDAWEGAPDSLRFEILQGVVFFVDLYHAEYDSKRLVKQLRKYEPLTIYREGRSMGVNMAGHKKYMYQVYRMYNGSSRKYALPLKF